METLSERQPKPHAEVSAVMYDLWNVDRRIKALAILFKNFGNGGCEISDAEQLMGIGIVLKDVSEDLGNIISGQLDGREFKR